VERDLHNFIHAINHMQSRIATIFYDFYNNK
jgi:hypothetical protein